MKVAVEIERKYLLRALPLPSNVPTKVRWLSMGYLTVGDPEVRIAFYRNYMEGAAGSHVPGTFQLTTKKGSGLARTEVIINVADDVGLALFRMTDPSNRIEKLRRWYGDWEVDIYYGIHAGLSVAEIELPSADAPIPPFPDGMEVRAEVTLDARFKNKALSLLDPRSMAALLRPYYRRESVLLAGIER